MSGRLPFEVDTQTHTHHRANDPVTSRLAAAEAAPRISENCLAVLDYLGRHPAGKTDEEGTEETGMHSYRRRRADLKNAGLVYAHGTRANSRGRQMAVWRVRVFVGL